jgi:TRAP-type C4-dicarboxylate transport system permease small subunit
MQVKSRPARLLDRIFDIEALVAAVALVLMMLVVVCDVTLRYLFNSPLRGSYDLVEILLVVMVFFGLPRLFADGAHIAIELIDAVAPALAPALSRLAALLSLLALLFIFYAMLEPTRSAFLYGDRSLELNLPEWIVWVLALVGLVGSIAAAAAAVLCHPAGADHARAETFE